MITNLVVHNHFDSNEQQSVFNSYAENIFNFVGLNVFIRYNQPYSLVTTP